MVCQSVSITRISQESMQPEPKEILFTAVIEVSAVHVKLFPNESMAPSATDILDPCPMKQLPSKSTPPRTCHIERDLLLSKIPQESIPNRIMPGYILLFMVIDPCAQRTRTLRLTSIGNLIACLNGKYLKLKYNVLKLQMSQTIDAFLSLIITNINRHK